MQLPATKEPRLSTASIFGFGVEIRSVVIPKSGAKQGGTA
jgi:hypothetical protein